MTTIKVSEGITNAAYNGIDGERIENTREHEMVNMNTAADKEKESSLNNELNNGENMLYGIEDEPPWYTTFMLSIQHFMTFIGGTIAIPVLLAPAMCIEAESHIRGTILSTILFVAGILTIIQVTFGVRLPIVQAASFGYLVPSIAVMNARYGNCDPIANMTVEEKHNDALERIQELQGSIAVASIIQVILGFGGLMGVCMKWITPLTITPTIALIGLSLFKIAFEKASEHWGIAVLTLFLLILFSQYLNEVKIPLISHSKTEGFQFKGFPLFKLFPVLLSIVISWLLCVILTVTNVLEEESAVRTDKQLSVIQDAPWFYVPYPFQWGMPSVSLAGVIGILSAVLVSMVESTGDYYACSKLAGVRPPLLHAINRGLGVEGVGCIIGGMFGTCCGLTSISQNIATIWITKVSSRRVIQGCGLLMIVIGMIGKLGGLFVTIPSPIIGAVFIMLFSLITAVGFSNLQLVDLNSKRNLFILGFSLFCGLGIPMRIKSIENPIETSSVAFNQVVIVLLTTEMFVGGFIAFILDNTIPGTLEERGMDKWTSQFIQTEDDGKDASVYDLPFGMEAIRRWNWCHYFPASPSFKHYFDFSAGEKIASIFNRLKETLHLK